MPAPKHIKAQKPVYKDANIKIVTLAEELESLKTMKQTYEELLKDVKERYNYLRKIILVKEMEKARVTGFRLDDGRLVYQYPRSFANITNANKRRAFTWFKNNGYEDIIQETIHPQTLNGTVNELRANGVKLPKCISTHNEIIVSIKSAPKKGD